MIIQVRTLTRGIEPRVGSRVITISGGYYSPLRKEASSLDLTTMTTIADGHLSPMAQLKVPYKTYEDVKGSTGNAVDSIAIKGIKLSGWTIESHRGSIADSKTIEESSSSWGIPLPEMPFDKNRLVLKHEASGWIYQFDAMQALRSIDGVDDKVRLMGIGPPLKSTKNVFGLKPNKSKRVKVAHASEWEKKRCVAEVEGRRGEDEWQLMWS
jgi:hypothetical protein